MALLRCPLSGWVDVPGLKLSDGPGKLSEDCRDSGGGRGVESEFVVAAAQVLHEGVPGDDHLRCSILQSAHRSEPALELAVIGLDRVVRVLIDMMPCGRSQFVQHSGVDR